VHTTVKSPPAAARSGAGDASAGCRAAAGSPVLPLTRPVIFTWGRGLNLDLSETLEHVDP
jgi:hypothetical protein